MASNDTPGEFIQTEMDYVVHVGLSGPPALLLTRVDPNKYKKFVVMEGGTLVI